DAIAGAAAFEAEVEGELILNEGNAVAQNDVVTRLVPLQSLDRVEMVGAAVASGNVVGPVVRNGVGTDVDTNNTRADVFRGVDAVVLVGELRLSAVQNVEAFGPSQPIVVLAPVKFVDAVAVVATAQRVASLAADDAGEARRDSEVIVA